MGSLAGVEILENRFFITHINAAYVYGKNSRFLMEKECRPFLWLQDFCPRQVLKQVMNESRSAIVKTFQGLKYVRVATRQYSSP